LILFNEKEGVRNRQYTTPSLPNILIQSRFTIIKYNFEFLTYL